MAVSNTKAMSNSKAMSEYELNRLERIKENQKMLEELFPEGTNVLTPEVISPYSGRSKRRCTDTNSRGTASGSDGVSEPSNSDEDGTPSKRKQRYSVR